MDYDRYRSTPHDDYDPRDPRAYEPSHGHDTQHHFPRHGRSRSPSRPPSDNLPQPTQQPLKSAIGNAFEQSDAARTVDPELIAQIAAEVKKSVLNEIKQSGIAGATPVQPGPPPPQQHIPPSPDSTSASYPTRNVYTPPSPFYPDVPSQPSAAEDVSTRGFDFDGASDKLSTPRHGSSVPIDIPHRDRAPERPAPATRMATDDFTPIEKMWQRLFDPDGRPLPRLGEFLRGLAMHLIEDYEPKKSLVISPAKMLKFYEDVKIHNDIYPWQTIFGELSYPALSKIYQSMRCQYHLVQEHPAEQPYIPALTPQGFQDWMTAMIKAYPDAEYERISKAVLDMPISNADDVKERFPKELPRRMFPKTENMQAQQRCAASLSAEGVGPLRKAPTFPPPPPPKVEPSTAGPNLERKRSPYSGHPDVKSSEFEDEHGSGFVPIERQRKPYSATPSGGKMYEDLSQSAQSDNTSTTQRRRAQSTTNQSQWAPPPSSDLHNQQQPRSSTRRARSPSFSGYGTYSDSNLNDVPASYYTSNMRDTQDEGRRRSKDEDSRRQNRHRRGTVGMDSSYDPQPRASYDDYKGRTGASGYEDRGYDFRRY